MDWLTITIVAVAGTAFGYSMCWFATWNKAHQQESHLRRLATDIAVILDMNDIVPPEWILNELDALIAQDYR